MRLIETEIRSLREKLLDMALLVQQQLQQANQAVLTHDVNLAQRVEAKEPKIDKFDNKIDKRSARILALYQPVANDLRFVLATIKINSWLEQIGDLIDSVAKKVSQTPEPWPEELLEQVKFQEMAETVQEVLSLAVDSFFQDNVQTSKSIVMLDDEVDEYYHCGKRRLYELIGEQPQNVESLVNLLMILKKLENIADYCVLIADESVYNIEAVMYKHSDSKMAYRSEGPTPVDFDGSAVEQRRAANGGR